MIALLDAPAAAKAEPLAAEFLEYLDYMDYNKYFDAMPTRKVSFKLGFRAGWHRAKYFDAMPTRKVRWIFLARLGGLGQVWLIFFLVEGG